MKPPRWETWKFTVGGKPAAPAVTENDKSPHSCGFGGQSAGEQQPPVTVTLKGKQLRDAGGQPAAAD